MSTKEIKDDHRISKKSLKIIGYVVTVGFILLIADTVIYKFARESGMHISGLMWSIWHLIYFTSALALYYYWSLRRDEEPREKTTRAY